MEDYNSPCNALQGLLTWKRISFSTDERKPNFNKF